MPKVKKRKRPALLWAAKVALERGHRVQYKAPPAHGVPVDVTARYRT